MKAFSHFPLPLRAMLAKLGYQADRHLLRRRGARLAKPINRLGATFIRPEVGDRHDFQRILRERGIRHVILGGTPVTAPTAPDGKFAVLIADEDTDSARDLLTVWPVGHRCDAYCPSGLPGFAFGDMSLFPPHLARRLLAGAHDAEGESVPDPREHFFSTIYREIYLRGLEAGVPSTLVGTAHDPVPAAARRWSSEAARLGIPLEMPVTLESLDALLNRHDWQPPLDILERVSCWNHWVALKLNSEGHGLGAEAPGLTVFYLRQRAIDQDKTRLVLDTLAESGFRLFDLPPLPPEEMAVVAAEVRGGNWGRGPWPISGGEPGQILIGFDPAPLPIDPATLAKFPLLDNMRINLAKEAVRIASQAGVPKHLRYNPLHSTDNAVQAWRVVKTLYPAHHDRLRNETM